MKKDRCTHFTILNTMQNDLIGQFKVNTRAKNMWDALRATSVGTATTSLCQLQMRFSHIRWIQKNFMTDHWRKTSKMVHDPNAATMFLYKSSKFKLYYVLYPDLGTK